MLNIIKVQMEFDYSDQIRGIGACWVLQQIANALSTISTS